MEASSVPSSSSNRTESAAEFVATVRKEHDVMMAWYNNINNASQELQRLREQYGAKYPESWKQVLNWNGWKDTRKSYLEHIQQHRSSTSNFNNTTVTAPAVATPPPANDATTSITAANTAVTTNEESTNDITAKPKRKSRWGSVSATSTTSTTNGGSSTSMVSTTDGTIIAGSNMDNSNGSKRGRWGTTTAPGSSATEMIHNGENGLTNATAANNNNNNNPSELEQLRVQLRSLNYKIDHVVEEANRIDALPHNHRERSVSPPPIYGPDGKRQNTRAVRYKERYTTERQDLLEKILELTNQQATSGTNGIAPTGMSGLPGSTNAGNNIGGLAGLLQYHKPTKKFEKIHIPVEKYPNYNFIGLIIGPRGKTQKELEAKTGCKIAIRGKGSVKEGARGRRDGSVDTADYEPLHVVVTGDDPRAVTAAATMIREMLIVIDDEKNVHKQQQLRELALLNGTLKDDNDGNSNAALYCPICAEKGHRAFECPKRFNAGSGAPAIAVKCAICGDTSHPTRDCKMASSNGGGTASNVPSQPNEKSIDSEYQSFMAELDGKTVPPSTTAAAAVSTLPLPPPPSGDIVPPALPPPPVLLQSTLPPPPLLPSNGDGSSIPNPLSLPPPPPPPPHLPGPPTGLPPPPPTVPAPYQYQAQQQQPYYQQQQQQYPPSSYTDQQQQQQQQTQAYNYNTTPGYLPPPPVAYGVQPPVPPTTIVKPGEETATWDPNAYYGDNNNTSTSLNWWEQ